MPRADDLFRPTAVPDPPDDDATAEAPPRRSSRPRAVAPAQVAQVSAEVPEQAAAEGKPQRTHSGRVKHDEKMTVYVTSDELLDLEHARLTLRRSLGTAVDRGRLVRAAVALALAELEEKGEESALAKRLAEG